MQHEIVEVEGKTNSIGDTIYNENAIIGYVFNIETLPDNRTIVHLCAARDFKKHRNWDNSWAKCDKCIWHDFGDWRLPSKDELNLMYTNLHKKCLGGFADLFYWSSSESYNGYAWYQYFGNGYQINYNKFNICRVRAVRSFVV